MNDYWSKLMLTPSYLQQQENLRLAILASLQEGEEINDLLKLSQEQILLRLAKYQLEMVSAGTTYS